MLSTQGYGQGSAIATQGYGPDISALITNIIDLLFRLTAERDRFRTTVQR